MSTDFHSIALSSEQQFQLALLARQTGKSPHDLIDQMLAQCEATTTTNGESSGRTFYDAFAVDRSIGMVKGDPTDMSTNPKYMEGFGRSGK